MIASLPGPSDVAAGFDWLHTNLDTDFGGRGSEIGHGRPGEVNLRSGH